MPQKEGKKILVKCSCGYKKDSEDNIKITEEVKEGKKVEVIEKEENTLPVVEAECPKCAHGKAQYWLIQTRAGDEPETRFYKCEKCKHTWRDYT